VITSLLPVSGNVISYLITEFISFTVCCTAKVIFYDRYKWSRG